MKNGGTESDFRPYVLVFRDSHELRTPMACIIGLLDMLLSEKLLDEIANSVRQIHRCATSLVAILNSALDIAKVRGASRLCGLLLPGMAATSDFCIYSTLLTAMNMLSLAMRTLCEVRTRKFLHSTRF